MILHFDADAFFASVEQAADKNLRGRPVAVGGERRGIIASASYEARRMGIYTPMPTTRAKKLCPSLVVLPCPFDLYEHFSRLMFSYTYDLTPLNTAGLRQIEHIARTPVKELALHGYALGYNPRPVICEPPEAKSYGEQQSFNADTTDETFILARLRTMEDSLMRRVRNARKSIRCVSCCALPPFTAQESPWLIRIGGRRWDRSARLSRRGSSRR